MTHHRKSLTLWTLLLLVFGFASGAAAIELEFSETVSLSENGRISLDNINGDVVIEAWDNAEVRIDYTKTARSQEGLDRMEVKIDASGSRVHIETDYAKRERGWSWGDHGGSVAYHLFVPRQARLDTIDLVNGRLEITGVEGDVAAELVNGDVKAEGLRGDIEIETVNGDVDIVMSELDASRQIAIESVNGSIELAFPSGVGADVHAETVHGRITNDFGIEVKKGRYVGRSMRGSVGGGGARVELENVNGSIRLRAD